jgi:hypothetical protein
MSFLKPVFCILAVHVVTGLLPCHAQLLGLKCVIRTDVTLFSLLKVMKDVSASRMLNISALNILGF